MIRSFGINRQQLNKLGIIESRKDLGLPPSLRNKFLFLWTGRYNGDNLLDDLSSAVITVTGRDWATSAIPDTTATFAVPDNATFLAADGTDDFWFNGSNVLQQKTFTELIESTTLRTFVKYTDFEPYYVSAIGILKNGEVITEGEKIVLNRYFKLWFLYWGDAMDSGYMKDNRSLGFVDDWYLPSILEVKEIYDELYLYDLCGFDKTGHYQVWSSSEEPGNPTTQATKAYFDPQGSGGYSSGPNNKNSNNRVWAIRSFISADVYALRDVGEGGGIIFIIVNNGNGTFTYYECYPAQVSGSMYYSNITNVEVGTGTAIGTGAANTAAIIAQGGHTDSAAKLCNDLST